MKQKAPAFVPPRDTASVLRREGMFRRLAQRARASAELVLPAVPSLCDHYADLLADHFAALGRPFSATELAQLQGLLLSKLQEAFAISPYSNVVVRYHTAAGLRIDYAIAAAPSSIEEEYAYWTQTREPPLFGKEPDARILAALGEFALPTSASCLDVGAGTGRNTLPLARRGMSVTAIEPAPALATQLEAAAAAEALSVRVIVADAVASPPALEPSSFSLAFASQVTSHFRGAAELRALFQLFARALAPGGHALATVFVTAKDFVPDRLSRELGQLFWSTFFTPAEIEEALSGLPLSRVSSEPALAYERAHQPAESWPPTSWFEGWASGEDIFGKLPRPAVTLEWLLLQRTAGAAP
ncbi:MAG: class I SAM-dependent methyltransferase [Polyangiaceae bacterium]